MQTKPNQSRVEDLSEKSYMFLVFFASLLYVELAPETQTPLATQSKILSSDELKTLSQSVQKDILDSSFFKEINKPQVIAISDFSNLTYLS